MEDPKLRDVIHRVDKRLAVIEERTRDLPEIRKRLVQLAVRNAGTAAIVALLVSGAALVLGKLLV